MLVMGNLFDPSAAPFTAALLMGVTCGVAYCGPACGPFLCTYIMGTQAGSMQGLKSLAVFTAARILTLGVLGFGSALLGTAILSGNGDPHRGSLIISVVIISIGVLMWLRPAGAKNQNDHIQIGAPPRKCAANHPRFKPTTPLWIVGAAFALAPCPPLAAMLVCSSQAASPLSGAVLMMLFGVGTAVSPLVFMAILAGTFSERIKTQAPRYSLLFQRASGAVLIVLGFASIL